MTTATALRPVQPRSDPPAGGRSPNVSVLDALGFDRSLDAIVVTADAPVYGGRFCAAPGCELEVGTSRSPLCRSHRTKADALGLTGYENDLEVLRRGNVIAFYGRDCQVCRVPGSQRAAAPRWRGLCAEHGHEFSSWAGWEQRDSQRVDEWIQAAKPTPFPTLGLCRASGCRLGQRRAQDPFCSGHLTRWHKHRERYHIAARDQGAEVGRFAGIAHLADSRVIALWRLHPAFHDEFLAGLVTTAELGAHIQLAELRALVRAASVGQPTTLEGWVPLGKATTGTRAATWLAAARRRATAGPDSERERDVWDLRVWGFRNGRIRFDDISQVWLREVTKGWAFGDLATRPLISSGATTRRYVDAVAKLSMSLRNRPDGGEAPETLGRLDVERFLDQCNADVVRGGSHQLRVQTLHRVRAVLAWARETGAVDPPRCGYRLDARFTVRAADCPLRSSERGRRSAPEEESGRPYTAPQQQAFLAALPESRGSPRPARPCLRGAAHPHRPPSE